MIRDLTGKYTITPNVTLDFALNPDFAQVESDQLVVTSQPALPDFLSREASFFLEGIDIFNTQISAVHTRAIVDPDVAVKLTGKSQSQHVRTVGRERQRPGQLDDDGF